MHYAVLYCMQKRLSVYLKYMPREWAVREILKKYETNILTSTDRYQIDTIL